MITIKSWAKAAGINDAKEQTLSSYTLTLMVLHFLQAGTRPPVLPSLQAVYPSMFMGMACAQSVSFFPELPTKYQSSNKQSLGEKLRCRNYLSGFVLPSYLLGLPFSRQL